MDIKYRIILIVGATIIFSSLVNAEILERTVTWTNWKEFSDAGWAQRSWVNVTEKPSQLAPHLLNLNEDSSGVWGWLGEWDLGRDDHNFNLSKSHDFCGIIYASLTVKFYVRHAVADHSYVSPTKPCSTKSCWSTLHDSNGISWQRQTWEIDLSSSDVIAIHLGISRGGAVLFDEISLTYVVRQTNANRPNSCSGGCKYVGMDCHNYYSCVDGKQKEFYSCKSDEGLAFNPRTKSCDLLENVKGCGCRSTTTASPTTQPSCGCGYRSHPENRTLYYYCENVCNQLTCLEKECPNGLAWVQDPVTKKYRCGGGDRA